MLLSLALSLNGKSILLPDTTNKRKVAPSKIDTVLMQLNETNYVMEQLLKIDSLKKEGKEYPRVIKSKPEKK